MTLKFCYQVGRLCVGGGVVNTLHSPCEKDGLLWTLTHCPQVQGLRPKALTPIRL